MDYLIEEETTSNRFTPLRITQNVLLIWLDATINTENSDCQQTITDLRRVINNIDTFTETDKCLEFIKQIKTEKACLITSGALGQHVVPIVHEMVQIDTIFIFCGNQKANERWAKDWPKIRGVLTDIYPICRALRQVTKRCEQNALPVGFIPRNDDDSSTRLNHLNPSFLYTQILKEILLNITFTERDTEDFLEYCRGEYAGNAYQLDNIKKLETKYRDETPVWWYSYECFLYPLLNRSLRTMETGTIIKMGFFVSDLHQYMKRLYEEQGDDDPAARLMIVYRGQGLSKTDFNQMLEAKGGFMSFNNFLSATKNRNISDGIARAALNNIDLMGILFVMTLGSTITVTTAPFASVTAPSADNQKQEEVLFSIHTIFRINDIKPMGENNRLWEADLTLVNDNDLELCTAIESIRSELTEGMEEETEDPTEWDRLGLLLLKLRLPEKAQQTYEIMREQVTDEYELAAVYHGLAQAKTAQGKYTDALTFHEKALAIREKILPSDHPHLANSYMKTGNVYAYLGEYSKALLLYEKALDMWQKTFSPDHLIFAGAYMSIGELDRILGEYNKALDHYEKALEIWQNNYPPNHPDLAMAYVMIGNLRNQMGEYSDALLYCEKAFDIIKTTLPSDYPDVAITYRVMGNIHSKMNEHTKALSYFEKALEVLQKSTSVDHPYFAFIYDNIGDVYRNTGGHTTALMNYEKALDIRQKAFSLDHPDIATSYNNIGGIYSRLGDHAKTLSYCEKALQIGQKTLPADHPTLAVSYNSIGGAYFKLGEYSEALSYYQEALEIRQKTLPPNHIDLATSHSNIGLIYDNMGDHAKALASHKKSLEIQEFIYPPDDLRLSAAYNNLGLIYDSMGDHVTALLYYEKDLEISEKNLPRTHPDLATTFNNIGLAYDNMGDYEKALSSHERALEIYEETLPSDHPHVATSYNNIGLVYGNLIEYTKALACHEKALEIREKRLSSNHPDIATSYNNIGTVYDSMKDYEKAVSYFERAVEIGQCSLPGNNPSLQLWKANLERAKNKL